MKPDLFNLLLVEWSVQKRGGTVLSRWRTNWAGEMDYASSSVRVKWFCVWVLKWASFYFNSFNFLTGFFYIYNCKHIFYAHVFIMKCSICVWIVFFFSCNKMYYLKFACIRIKKKEEMMVKWFWNLFSFHLHSWKRNISIIQRLFLMEPLKFPYR